MNVSRVIVHRAKAEVNLRQKNYNVVLLTMSRAGCRVGGRANLLEYSQAVYAVPHTKPFLPHRNRSISDTRPAPPEFAIC